jgi:hypothetical protein
MLKKEKEERETLSMLKKEKEKRETLSILIRHGRIGSRR